MSNSLEQQNLIDGITLPHENNNVAMGYQSILGQTSIIVEEVAKIVDSLLLGLLLVTLVLFAYCNLPRQPNRSRDAQAGDTGAAAPSRPRRTLNAIPAKQTVGLVERACMDSGVSQDDAFSIDEAGVNLYERLGGDGLVFRALSAEFYRRVYSPEHSPEWFRNIFRGSLQEDAASNQSDFFIQRMGGPPLFSERRGHPALIRRHVGFDVTPEGAELWLGHMQAALDSTAGLDMDSKRRMRSFFRHTAFFLVHGNAASRAQAVASRCAVPE
jgi:truncated hemoglobin YjbI